MNKISLTIFLCGLTAAAPALAGDPAAGEKGFNKCKACHSIIAADGTEVVKGGKTGPNLWGVIGRPVASAADFAYGDSIKAVGATGAVWDEAALDTYLKAAMKAVPGTRMAFAGVFDAADRKALILYLDTQK